MEEKECKKCGNTKPLDQFHRRSSAKDGHQRWCKACNCQNRMAVYKRPGGRDSQRAYVQRLREARHQRLIEYLRSHPCVECGESDIEVLEFDHRDQAKKISAVTGLMLHSEKKMWEEVEKCDVRCCNCHRRRTNRQRGSRRLARVTQ